MTEVHPPSSLLRDTPQARIWASIVVWSLFAVLPFVYAKLWATTFPASPGEAASVEPGGRVWLAFAVAQVANKVPVAYRYAAGPVVAALDLLGFSAGLAAVVALGTGFAVPMGAMRNGWFLLVAAWLVASVWHQLDPDSRHNQGVAWGRRLYCALVATLVPSLPFAFAVLLAPGA